jgi:hypothetical protein
LLNGVAAVATAALYRTNQHPKKRARSAGMGVRGRWLQRP